MTAHVVIRSTVHLDPLFTRWSQSFMRVRSVVMDVESVMAGMTMVTVAVIIVSVAILVPSFDRMHNHLAMMWVVLVCRS